MTHCVLWTGEVEKRLKARLVKAVEEILDNNSITDFSFEFDPSTSTLTVAPAPLSYFISLVGKVDEDGNAVLTASENLSYETIKTRLEEEIIKFMNEREEVINKVPRA